MIKQFSYILLLLCLTAFTSWAGDVATFVNMGFSDDARFFLFGQYGYDESKRQVYAQAIFVDIEKNDYTKDGFHQRTLASNPQSGDIMDGAFLELIEQLATIRKKYKINYALKGRIIYASSVMRESARTAQSKSSESLQFRDFEANRTFNVTLNQNVANPQKSTFAITFTITHANNTKHSYTVGHPDIQRHVSHYEIDRIIVSPNGKSLIFIVAMRMPNAQGTPNVRYMVEAIQIES
ncbi:DUF2259 domain-containing protein [Entomospira culicis]|uniref:DUF2259 domain-containing protein n=1 Tax=Entomospira culicis TaxID=2719989 RepID=A0A968KTS1_9SPIO|nr:DUF2259 domain-containing protein [Entomospira culicis]NIZ18533.1 DUF2259 domain-containing protein [Entomospira culicis]NIZ68749.1 DUF2259 domain-containing protein [Entomospira culicis]WDI37345.1 DUF2259 domain-containing protein [Entomospira culicis]WDI38974.1 DUF2259 domain-containing protein [Entomospira culicis]